MASAAAQIDNRTAVPLSRVAGVYQANLDLSQLGAGEHAVSVYTNGATTPAARKVFRRSHPVYVYLTTDWDTGDSPDSALALQDELHATHPALEITHFVGPYTFTDPTVSVARRSQLVSWLNGQRSQFGDEIGLHIHPYCNFVNTVGGVPCRTTPTYSTSAPDPTGYTVPLSAYIHLHDKIAKQHKHLTQALRGHYGYFGITGNANALSRFLYEVTQVWQKWLHRRTGRGAMPWPRFMRVLKRYPLPPPRVVHSVYRT